MKHYSCEDVNKPPLTTDRELVTAKHEHHQVQLGEPMDFMEVTHRNMGERLLTGAEMTAASPKPTQSNMGDSSQKHSTQPAGSSTDWRVTFPDASVGLSLFWNFCLLCFFHTAWLISASFQLSLSESDLQPSLLFTLGEGEGLRVSS